MLVWCEFRVGKGFANLLAVCGVVFFALGIWCGFYTGFRVGLGWFRVFWLRFGWGGFGVGIGLFFRVDLK